ncbi:unannotated protein [freshwater metagenome]|uniref:Unannotated protein n=1 Tax=freshwater metagenome TaxID=449393 RepID=A0A6J6LWI3_9ZZZZ|nr:TIGR03085 family protein [Actinomycetota bacterium]MSY51830.1 TIGR03085 family protein [Actinomycetota bacterium]MSY86814.1 TIGR03085 family protein [Actinomycetota bacterium]MTA50215.1 TIGR03085 family protein [Actinomycetota bacterium]
MSESLAHTERLGLVALFRSLGPSAPTLCQGWRTADLLAHLVLRERKPVAALGILVPPLSERTERLTLELASDFEANIRLFESGPPAWNPMRYLDAMVNGSEMLIHHEDVLRAQPGWRARVLSPQAQQETRRILRGAAQLMTRGAKVKVRPDPAGTLTPASGEVVIRGDVVDILLRVAGRTENVQVTIVGAEPDLALFENSRLGI